MELGDFFAYSGLIAVASTSVYAGSRGSLKKSPTSAPDSSSETEDEGLVPRLTSSDAWLFPVMGSIALGSLFLIIKYLGKEWINWLMSWYFSFAGLYSMPDTALKCARSLVGKSWETFPQHGYNSGPFKAQWRTPAYFLIPLTTLPVLYFQIVPAKMPALLTDAMALSFAHEAISLLQLDSWNTGCILLSGLFLYDIYWVFGTKVMLSVATNLDVPIKLLWPRSLTNPSQSFMMLGLGDIVVPGVFVALALRYDQKCARARNQKGSFFPKPYFNACLMAYVLGLYTTMSVMHFFQAAQPALLYLSPACILAFLFTAIRRGELGEAWNWTDSEHSKDVRDSSKPNNSTQTAGASDIETKKEQ